MLSPDIELFCLKVIKIDEEANILSVKDFMVRYYIEGYCKKIIGINKFQWEDLRNPLCRW